MSGARHLDFSPAAAQLAGERKDEIRRAYGTATDEFKVFTTEELFLEMKRRFPFMTEGAFLKALEHLESTGDVRLID